MYLNSFTLQKVLFSKLSAFEAFCLTFMSVQNAKKAIEIKNSIIRQKHDGTLVGILIFFTNPGHANAFYLFPVFVKDKKITKNISQVTTEIFSTEKIKDFYGSENPKLINFLDSLPQTNNNKYLYSCLIIIYVSHKTIIPIYIPKSIPLEPWQIPAYNKNGGLAQVLQFTQTN